MFLLSETSHGRCLTLITNLGVSLFRLHALILLKIFFFVLEKMYHDILDVDEDDDEER